MDLSIIIVSWRVKELLKDCLVSIYNETHNLNYEVFVVDNNSGDGTIEMIMENFPQVNIISSSRNLGFAAGCNIGLKQATGRYLLLLNPDTKIIDQALNKMVAYMDLHKEYGLAGCQLLNYNGSIQESVRKLPTFKIHLAMIFRLQYFILNNYLGKNIDYTKEQEVEQIMGSFYMIRREVFEELGLMDNKFYLWFDEVDYSARAREKNFKTIYTPRAKVIHYGNESFKQAANIKKQWYFSKSRLRYVFKHNNKLAWLIILLLTPISLLITLIYSLFKKNA